MQNPRLRKKSEDSYEYIYYYNLIFIPYILYFTP